LSNWESNFILISVAIIISFAPAPLAGMNLPAAETAGYLKGNRALSFPLVGNPSERFWTSQNDRNKDTPQQRLWGIENLIKMSFWSKN
jgi:hypothetical protein